MDARNQVPQVRVIPNISVIRDTVMALVAYRSGTRLMFPESLRT